MGISANDELVQALRALLDDGGPAARGAAAHLLAEYSVQKPKRRTPPPLIAALCSCGALMNGIHSPGCPNRPTSTQASLKSRRKAQESGWVRAEVLLSPAMNAKLDRLAVLHGSRNEAIRAAIAAL